LQTLQSISPISKVYQTSGSNPVKVLCSDLNEYVVKYKKFTPASDLFNEFLASEFLRLWTIRVPDSAIVTIKDEHIPAEIVSPTIQPAFFHAPCFGSKHNDFAKEMEPLMGLVKNDTKIIKRIRNKEEFLIIALFDLWMTNEDRRHNNNNLLLNTDPEYYFVPIDHVNCFNSNSLAVGRGMEMLTEEDTIINTDLAKVIFQNSKSLLNQIDGVIVNYYLWVSECQKSLENIVNAMPDQWGIAKADKIALLNSTLFQLKWISDCEATFKDYTERFLLS
jgi:hypothetical protein